MSQDRKLGNPDSETEFYQHISHLVGQSLGGRPDRARKAKNKLIQEVTAYPSYDPVLLVFEQAQKVLIKDRDPKIAGQTVGFMHELCIAVQKDVLQKIEKPLHLSPLINRTAGHIIQNDVQIQQNPYLQTLTRTTQTYGSMVKRAVAIKDAADEGSKSLRVRFLPQRLNSDEERKIAETTNRKYNGWLAEVNLSLLSESGGQKVDWLVDALKREPPLYPPGPILFDREYAGMSLRQIESMPYPLGEGTLDKITDYLGEIFSSTDTLSTHRQFLGDLFFNPIFFYDNNTNQQVQYRNHNFLTNVSRWQRRFIEDLLLNEGKGKEKQIQAIFKNISRLTTHWVVAVASLQASYASELDPDFHGDNMDQRFSFYLLQQAAITQYQKDHPGDKFVLIDEIGSDYFRTTLFPRLEQILNKLGLAEYFREAIEGRKTFIQEHPFSEAHLEALQEVFRRNCGIGFIDRLNSHSFEITQVAQQAWQSIFDRGLDFLPMQNGINTIKFSEGGVGNILGLEQMSFNRIGLLPDWQIHIGFDFQDTSIHSLGELDQQGKLLLKAPLEREIPGLYAILNTIAILAFRDLVIQEEGERKVGKRKESSKVGQVEKFETEEDVSIRKIRESALPRVGKTQTDTALIRDIYKYTGFTPRRVALHRRWLTGHQEYKTAVDLYNEAVASKASELTMKRFNQELEEARKKARKASDEKIKKMPARFQLEHVIDPVTTEVRYLRTWVVEHSIPRPSNEELRSPVKLYQKYYSESSALAFLDQMKPWFVGE